MKEVQYKMIQQVLSRRLGPNFREHAPSHVDETKKKLWFAGSPDVDKVRLCDVARHAPLFNSSVWAGTSLTL